MKTALTYIFIAIAIFYGFDSQANPNVWSGQPKGSFWNNWALTLNGGFTSYYGDLSVYDSDLSGKIKFESKPAFGFLITKYFTDEVGLSGQFLYGGLKGTYNENLSFDTDLIEYNVQLRIDLLNLIFKKNNSGLGVVAFGGIGHMIFRTEKYSIEEGTVKSSVHQAQAPEFVYFLGGGVEYIVAERFNIGIDLGIRQPQNDRIDNEVRQDNYDFYSYASVGVTYFFGRNFKYSKKSNIHRSGVKMAGN